MQMTSLIFINDNPLLIYDLVNKKLFFFFNNSIVVGKKI
jgi:hypothetical protein